VRKPYPPQPPKPSYPGQKPNYPPPPSPPRHRQQPNPYPLPQKQQHKREQAKAPAPAPAAAAAPSTYTLPGYNTPVNKHPAGKSHYKKPYETPKKEDGPPVPKSSYELPRPKYETPKPVQLAPATAPPGYNTPSPDHKHAPHQQPQQQASFNHPSHNPYKARDPNAYKQQATNTYNPPQALKQSYSADNQKPVFLKASAAPTTVYLNPQSNVYAQQQKSEEPPVYTPGYPAQKANNFPGPSYATPTKQNYQDTLFRTAKNPQGLKTGSSARAAPKAPSNSAPQKTRYNTPVKQNYSVNAPKTYNHNGARQEQPVKQTYSASASISSNNGPPKSPSYAPPSPTYKPKPTYQPKPKPVYNPPPSSPPHIIYAGHPPIHIYQQPPVQVASAPQPVYQPEKPVYKPPTKQNYSASAPKPTTVTYKKTAPAAPAYKGPSQQSYKSHQTSYNQQKQNYQASASKPSIAAPKPSTTKTSYGPPKAPAGVNFGPAKAPKKPTTPYKAPKKTIYSDAQKVSSKLKYSAKETYAKPTAHASHKPETKTYAAPSKSPQQQSSFGAGKQNYQGSAQKASYKPAQTSFEQPKAQAGPNYGPPKAPSKPSYGPAKNHKKPTSPYKPSKKPSYPPQKPSYPPQKPSHPHQKSNYGAQPNYPPPPPPKQQSYGVLKPSYPPQQQQQQQQKREHPKPQSGYPGPPPKPKQSRRPPPPPQKKQNYQQRPYRPAARPPPPPQRQQQPYQIKNSPVYVPAPKAYHKPPIIIYQGVAPPVHVYEKPAGTPYTQPAKAKSSNIVELEGWTASNGASARSDTQPTQLDINVLTANSGDLSTSADSSGNWVTKSVVVGKSIGALSPTKIEPKGEPRAEARIDLGGASSDFESSAVVRAKVSVGSQIEETLKKGTVEDIKNE
jgi:hypothetical protein